MEKGLFESEAFLSLDHASQTKVAENHFKETLATSSEYAKLPQDQKNSVYNNYLSEVITAAPKEEKGFVRRVVDGVDTFMKDPIGNIIGKRDNSQNFPAKKPQPKVIAQPQTTQQEDKPKGTTIWDHALDDGKHYQKVDTRYVDANTPEKMKVLLKSEKKKKEDEHNKLNQQLGDAPLEDATLDVAFVGGGAVHSVKGVGEIVAGNVLKNKEMIQHGAKAYSSGGAFAVGDAAGQLGAEAGIEGADAAMSEEFKKENPKTAEAIKLGTGLLLGGVAGYKAEVKALSRAQQQIFDATDDIIKTSSESIGIDLPKPAVSVAPDDEVIAKAIADEYGTPKAKEENPYPEGTRVADSTESIVEPPKAIEGKIQQVIDDGGYIHQEADAMVPEKKVLSVNEYDELKTNLLKYDDEDSANEIMSRYIRSEDPTTKPDVPDMNVGDIQQTKIAEDPKLKATEETNVQNKNDVGSIPNVSVKEPVGNETDTPFSKGESIADVHTLESMQQSVRDAIGEAIDTRLSPIMGTITKADIPEAVLKEAGDSADGIHGFIHEGRAYIVADNIPKEWSASQIRGLVMHEVGVHLRKAGSGDKDFGRIIEAMRVSDDPLIKEAYARVPQTTAVHRVDEEALAYLIQTHPDTTIARRVIAWVKQQLIRLSISPSILKMTPQDLSAMAWGAVKRDVRAIDNPDIRLSMEMEKRYMEKGKLTKQIQKDAVELPPALSRGQFYKQYGTSGWVNIDTPVGKMRFNVKEAYNHIAGQNTYYADRLNISGAFHTLFTDPLIVSYNPMKKQTEYFTPFKDNDEVIHLLGVAKDDKGNMVLKTFFDITDKTGDIERIVKSTEGNAKYFKYSSSVASKGDEAGDAAGQILKKSSDKEIVQQPKDKSQEVQFSRVQEEPQPTPEPAQSAGGFYSVAQKAIETMPNKMNVSAFRNYLKGKGIKNDEMIYGGIAKAIEGKETITKAEMLEALNNPEMGKVVMGGKDIKLPDYAMDYLNSMDKPERDIAHRMITLENRSKLTDGSYEKEWEQLIEKYPNLDHNMIHDAGDDMLDMARTSDAETKYQQYSIKGIGENYREELTKFSTEDDFKNWVEKYRHEDDPTWEQIKSDPKMYSEYHRVFMAEEPMNYRSSHWDEPNVLYHVRKQDTTIDGEKTLLIEEIQSDWHQDGRKKGYRQNPKELSPNAIEMQKLNEKSWNGELTDAEKKRLKELKSIGAGDELVNRIEAERSFKNSIPQAPYSKNWHEKALKDQIDEAVRKGYDRVAWVDGKTSADRYSLSKSVDRLVYNKDVGIIAGYKNGEEVIYKTATDGELTAIIGKDPAKKLMDNEVHPGVYEIKGEALDIGGDGMRGFYDKILPDYARKYIKKWGAEVEKKTLSDGTEVWSFPVTKEMSEDVAMNGQPLYAHGLGAVAGIETDEDGNIVGFNPLMALAGAAAGSMLVSKSVRGAVAKVAARAEKLSDAAARNLIVATVKGVDKITAGVVTKTVDKIVSSDMADYIIGHKIYRMKDYMKMREEALRSANAGMESAARLHLQLTEFSSEAREAMYEYMSGNKEVILTPELKRAADTFVEKIDGMGKTMVDEGFLSKEAYEEWKGQYLHRRYASKMKRTSDWASGKGEFAVDKIQMRGKTWNASEEEYQELLKVGQIGKVSEGKIEVLKDADGTYKLRRDWTREERTAMGEIRDVAYSLPETIGRMAQMIEFGKMLKSVPSKYILAQEGRADNVMKQLGYEKLSGSRYGALNDKWVNQSIAGDLKRVSNDVMGEEGNVKRMWSDYVSAMKMSHTVYNPTAHVNNVGSNVFLQTAAGLNPILTIKYATDGARAARKAGIWRELDAKRITGLSSKEEGILSKLEADEDVALWRELNDNHMFGRSQLNEMLRTYMSPHVDTAAGSVVNKVSEGAKALYQAEDDVMRFSAIKQLTRDGMWDDSGDGLVKRKMGIDEAMTHVNDTIVPDYTKPMSKLALTLRDSGLVPFMSWTYYSTPILIKQLRDHPTRVMAIAAGWYGLDRLFGVDPYDDESMPKGFAEQRVAVGRDGDKVTGFRVSSMIPHIQLANPANTFLEPLTSGIPQTMLGSATNYNFYFRKPITTKEGGEGAYHRGKDIAMNVLPSPDVFDKAYNLAESKLLDKETRRRDPVFEPRTPAQEAASFFVNLQTYDVSNNRERMRKDKITSGRNEKKWDKKTDDAMRKMERIFQ